MNADQLLELYDRVADAPDAIPRLRRFVLDLAMRGKLVEQDAADEPASELLKRIAKEKARLVKAGEIKKSEVDGLAVDDEPFELPTGWAWTRLGSIGDWGAGSTPSRGNSELYGGSVTWLKSGELNDNIALAGSEETVTEVAVIKGSFRVNKPGDVLLAMSGATIGKLAILAETAVTNQAVCGCTPFDGVTNRFLFLFLLSYRAKFHAASEGGAQPNISKVKIVGTPFPLPPLAEQHRIVAKVDELMALLDGLEQARVGREVLRDQLTAATLNRLTQSDPDDFRPAAHFALQALSHLTTRPDQIKTLRQTILNLAVRGKLVEQDPADEPASELLKRIGKQRLALIAAGIAKKEKLAEAVAAPFTLPESWTWCGLGQLCQLITKGSSPKWQGVSYVTGESGLMFITSENVGNFILRKLDDLKYVESRFRDIEPRSMLKKGDILINLVGASIGRTAIFNLDAEANINQAVALVRLVDPTLGPSIDYLLMYLNSDTAVDQMLGSRVITAQPNISLADVNGFPIPLPPLAEQHRIVARVDALMALCDQLEVGLKSTDTTRSRLLDAILYSALSQDAVA